MNVAFGWILGGGLGLLLCGVLVNLLAFRWRPQVTEEQRLEALKHKQAMEALVSTPGWKLLEEAAEVQARARRNEVMMKPAEQPLVQEFEKGTVQGIELFVKLPRLLIENSKAVLDAYEQQQGDR